MPSSRCRARLRLTVLLLVVLCAALGAALVSCPRPRVPVPPTAPAAEVPPPGPSPAPAVEPSRGPAAEPPGAPATEPGARRGLLAIVIDDAGYDLDALQPFLDLPMPVAVAVLPNLPQSAEAARRVRAAGKEVLLHLPMEPAGGEDPGPGALLTGLPAAEIERLLDAALATVPGASGVNNHMGSKATADPAFMAVVLCALGRRGLFFVDSRTTAATVAAAEADRLGVPVLERRVFLDAVDGRVEESVEAAIAAASREGRAVAIGHVQTEGLAAILRGAAGGMERAGVRPATLAALVAGGGEGAAR